MTDNEIRGDRATGTMLLGTAVLGLLYEAGHIFGGEWLVSHLGSQEGALIFLVSFLCGGLGLERWFILHKVRAKIENILETVGLISKALEKNRKQILGELHVMGIGEGKIIDELKGIDLAQPLIGTKAIEDAARNLIDGCSDSDKIKATTRDTDPLSDQYDKTLINRVQRAKQNNGNMKYHLLVPGGSGSDAGSAEERKKLFQQANIADRLVIRRAKHSWPFEVLIGGGTMIIALVGGEKDPTYEVAVRVTDPEFVEKASEWFKDIEIATADRDS